MSSMKVATLEREQTIVFSQQPIPACGEGDALIRVKRLGICGSDIHAYYGKHPYMSFPIVLGHEFSGGVEAVGGGVSCVSVGERVTVMPQLTCGQCAPCRAGRYNICETLKVIGCQTQGAAAQYALVPAKLIKKLPDDMDFDTGAMIEPAAVGVHACRRLGDVTGQNIVVLGAGTIGNLCAQAALALGAADVLITDLSDHRLRVARDCGIPHTLNTGKEDLRTAIQSLWGSHGADAFMECVGVGATANQAVELSQKGRDIIIVGVFGQKPPFDLGLIQDKELRVVGTLMYVESDYDAVMDFVSRGKIKLMPLKSQTFPFDAYPAAFRAIESQGDSMLKVLIEVE